jgi:hypothetical protein
LDPQNSDDSGSSENASASTPSFVPAIFTSFLICSGDVVSGGVAKLMAADAFSLLSLFTLLEVRLFWLHAPRDFAYF